MCLDPPLHHVRHLFIVRHGLINLNGIVCVVDASCLLLVLVVLASVNKCGHCLSRAALLPRETWCQNEQVYHAKKSFSPKHQSPCCEPNDATWSCQSLCCSPSVFKPADNQGSYFLPLIKWRLRRPSWIIFCNLSVVPATFLIRTVGIFNKDSTAANLSLMPYEQFQFEFT